MNARIIGPIEENPRRRKRRKRRKRNPEENPRHRRARNPKNNHSGLGAFIGSVVGGIPGTIMAATGLPGSSYAAAWWPGWIAGGAIGGYLGAKNDRKTRGALGGGIGGIFGPLGAALGGYLGGRKPDRRSNPAPWVLPTVAVSALVLAGGGLVLYQRMKKKKALEPGPVVEPPNGAEGDDDLDDWGFPLQDIRVEDGATSGGVRYRIYQSVTEGTFYGAWQLSADEVGVINSPYLGEAAQPWGIDETRQRTIAAAGVPA
jgi:MFS family permease